MPTSLGKIVTIIIPTPKVIREDCGHELSESTFPGNLSSGKFPLQENKKLFGNPSINVDLFLVYMDLHVF